MIFSCRVSLKVSKDILAGHCLGFLLPDVAKMYTRYTLLANFTLSGTAFVFLSWFTVHTAPSASVRARARAIFQMSLITCQRVHEAVARLTTVLLNVNDRTWLSFARRTLIATCVTISRIVRFHAFRTKS